MSSPSANLSVPALFDVSQHVVLVTGGASGLGEMAAQGFVQNGARVIIASRKEAELRKTADRLNGLGPGTCDFVVADLKDKAGCDALVAAVKAKTDRLTVLVNNSGASWLVLVLLFSLLLLAEYYIYLMMLTFVCDIRGAPYYDFPESGWDKLMALNVKAMFYSK